MKKNIIKIALIVIITLFGGYNLYSSQKGNTLLSDLMLENVEALAQESGGSPIMCRYSFAYDQCYQKPTGSACLLVDLGSCRWL